MKQDGYSIICQELSDKSKANLKTAGKVAGGLAAAGGTAIAIKKGRKAHLAKKFGAYVKPGSKYDMAANTAKPAQLRLAASKKYEGYDIVNGIL